MTFAVDEASLPMIFMNLIFKLRSFFSSFFGASFLAVSVDHPICKKFLEDKEYKEFKKECLKVGTTEEALANAEKIGFDTKLFAAHPFIKDKKLPVYVANFILMAKSK